MIGDYNARTGYELDTISTIDEDIVFTIYSVILCVDNVVNGHGRLLLEFLCDNALCVLNGRFGLINTHLFQHEAVQWLILLLLDNQMCIYFQNLT